MKPWFVLGIIPVITGFVFGLSSLWEFGIEDLVMPLLIDTHKPESFVDRMEFIVTASVLTFMATCPPTILLLRSTRQHRQATKRLQISERRLRDAQRRALVGHWELKPGDDKLTYSEQVLRNLGFDEVEFELHLGDFYDRVHPEDRDRVKAIIDEALRDHRPGAYKFRAILPDGEVRTIHTVFDFEFDDKGRLECLRGVDQDVTTHTKERRELQDSLARVQQLSNAQQKFVANAAHELRTPLAILKAQIETHKPGFLSNEEIEGGVDRAIRLVNQMVEAARYDSGSAVDMAPVDMVAVASEVVRGLGPLAVKEGKTISLTANDGPVAVNGSYDALVVALRNLVENALAYTRTGTNVSIRVSADGTVSVADRGLGIPGDERSKVFRRFWRGSNSRGKVGSGLGLAMVAEIMESHGGDIAVDDHPSGGMIFTMKLDPAAPGDIETEPGTENFPLPSSI